MTYTQSLPHQDIRLFVSCHGETYVPPRPFLQPIQVGTVLSKERFALFEHDDMGDNISNRYGQFKNLTTQYWAWKNVAADYYGFMDDQRYLEFAQSTRDAVQ